MFSFHSPDITGPPTVTDEWFHLLVSKFKEVRTGKILMIKPRQVFGHESPQKFPVLKIFGSHQCRLFVPRARPWSPIERVARMRAGIYIIVSFHPSIRIPEYPIIGIQGLLRYINVNRLRPFLEILVRRLNIGCSTAKYADKNNFLTILSDNRTTTTTAQATVPRRRQ